MAKYLLLNNKFILLNDKLIFVGVEPTETNYLLTTDGYLLVDVGENKLKYWNGET